MKARALTTYYGVAGLHTFAASLVWVIDTLFLLDAGLGLGEVFLVQAVGTATIALCEVPTGVVADVWGRRVSVVLSAVLLAAGTLTWIVADTAGLFALGAVALGLGATFYSGAAEAWLVDATEGLSLERVLARGQLVTGALALAGTLAGGLLAGLDLAWPYWLRLPLLAAVAWLALRGMAEAPRPRRRLGEIPGEIRRLARTSFVLGARRPGVRGLLAVSCLQYGVLTWAFIAWQPHLLALLGRDVPWMVGVVGALVTVATLAGNALVDRLARSGSAGGRALVLASSLLAFAVASVGWGGSFGAALAALLLMSAASGVVGPLKQAELHRRIPADQRATLISLDSLVSNAGGAAGQSALGAVARARGLAPGYLVGGLVTALALPLLAGLGYPGGSRASRETIRDGGPE